MNKIVVVTFADDAYREAQKINVKSAEHIGRADRVYAYSPQDIDPCFLQEYQDIFKIQRGCGLWLWKPYLINKVLEEELDEGDILFYIDAGAFFIGNIRNLIRKTKDFSLLVFDTPLKEEQFTKKDVFEKMNCNNEKYRESNQIMATYFLIRKNSQSKKIIKEWLELCCNISLIMPSDGIMEKECFIAHREDQSIFSLVCKKNGIIPQMDISQRRWFPRSYVCDRYEYCPVRHKGNRLPVIIYLHKMRVVKLIPLLKQLFRYIKTNFQ